MRSNKYFFLFPMIVLSLFSCVKKADENPIQKINAYYLLQIDSLNESVKDLLQSVEGGGNEKDIQHLFKQSRYHWKHIEPLTEYYFANVSEFINGPALLEEEDYDAKMIEPSGYQMIEEYIFPTYDVAGRKDLIQQIKMLQSSMGRLKQLFETNTLSDANVFEASRLELLRIMSLGISGFDSPIAFQSVSEANHALKGVSILLEAYADRSDNTTLRSRFDTTDKFLTAQNDFIAFDRAHFIRKYLIPLSEEIYLYQQHLKIPNNKWLMAIDLTKTNFADASIFNKAFFSPNYTQELAPGKEMTVLGKILFFDPILSGNNARACASCHRPDKAFTDGEQKSKAFALTGAVFRNAPTLINSGLQKSQFADSRVAFLEDQITDVLHNPTEMHGDMNESVKKIRQSAEYRSMFSQAFPKDDTANTVTGKHIQIALATYVRSLNGLNSPFDQFMRGDSSALNKEEIDGFNLFMGKAKCATCHFMPLFNGTVPPMYIESESEVLGVPAKPDTARATVDDDEGKTLVSKKLIQRFMFKTTTVRNASLTAPYMHNGVFTTLNDVIDFYNRGGGAGIGINLDNQTLPPDALDLTTNEKKKVIAFIRALNDTTGIAGKPAYLPKTGIKGLDQRKIGGDY